MLGPQLFAAWQVVLEVVKFVVLGGVLWQKLCNLL